MLQLSRKQLFEFGDQAWFTGYARECYMDGLALIHRIGSPYAGTVAPLAEICRKMEANEVLDLASGPGEHARSIITSANARGIPLPRVVLSDMFPQVRSYQRLQNALGEQALSYISTPVSALRVSHQSASVRSIFTAFHHFSARDAAALIEDALLHDDAVFIAEFNRRGIFFNLSVLLAFPIFLLIPFIGSGFSIRRLLLCTLLPVVPVLLAFDGVVSNLRVYRQDEIRELVRSLGIPDVVIEHGSTKGVFLGAEYTIVYRSRDSARAESLKTAEAGTEKQNGTNQS